MSDLIIRASSTEPEEWRPCPGHEGVYEVSSLGRVRRIGRSPLKQAMGTNGYLFVSPCTNGKKRPTHVHTLVCRAFHGEPREYLYALGRKKVQEVRHLDGDRHNNRAQNLRWGTRHQNVEDRHAHGMTVRGSRHGMAKLSERDIPLIRSDPRSAEAVGADFGVSGSMVLHIRNRRNWKHVP